MKKKTGQSVVKILLIIIGVFIICMGSVKTVLTARAEEADKVNVTAEAAEKADSGNVTELGRLMTADRDVDMKAAPEEAAEIIMSYKKGDSVFATEETANGWYRVIYQDKEGYVPKDALHIQEIDVAGLDAEMARLKEETKYIVESVEKYRAEARRAKIWGSVIAALIIGIFAFGIASGIRGKNRPKREEEPGSQ